MEKICNKCKVSFTISEDNISFYGKMKVPLPNICPDCRFMMRSMWRNETTLYSGRKCDLCNSPVISIYNPKSLYKIYCTSCYYSDKWEPKNYELVYDFSKPFFEQLDILLKSTPKNTLGISSGDGINIRSEYINMASGCKDCYLVFNTSPAEELLYSRGVKNGKFSSDIYFGVNFENSYESINISKSSKVFFSQNVNSCVDSYFLFNSSNLINCFGCVNLKNKSYCWFNEQLTKEEYESRLNEVLGSYKSLEEIKIKFSNFKLKFPHKESNNLKTVDSTGDYLLECKSVSDSFELSVSENCSHCFSSKNIKDSIGTIGYGTNSENLLECVATGFSNNIIGSYWAENSQNLMYTFNLKNCTDCIGCDSLKNSKYCILNKQYEKSEYEMIKKHIISELENKGIHGLIMPPEIAPFGYNETIGNENMTLTKDEALKLGFNWQDDTQKTIGMETLKPEDITDNIKDVSDDITKEILKCVDCSRNYKITEQELFFYKRMNLPIPRKCFFCRHKDRIERRGPYKFWGRKCDKCSKNIYTNYAPDRSEIIYCEECYKRDVL